MASALRSPLAGAATLAALAALLALALPALAAQQGVALVGKSFDPKEVTIAEGDTVVWTVTRATADPHTVTSGKPGAADAGAIFESGLTLRANGDRFEFTFREAGRYPYYCVVHQVEMF